jgi:hypothetical protein
MNKKKQKMVVMMSMRADAIADGADGIDKNLLKQGLCDEY